MGAPENKKEAFLWMERAALTGDTQAQRLLGLYYKVGVGVDVNKTEAMRWFRKAAEQGDEDAQKELESDNDDE